MCHREGFWESRSCNRIDRTGMIARKTCVVAVPKERPPNEAACNLVHTCLLATSHLLGCLPENRSVSRRALQMFITLQYLKPHLTPEQAKQKLSSPILKSFRAASVKVIFLPVRALRGEYPAMLLHSHLSDPVCRCVVILPHRLYFCTGPTLHFADLRA